MTKKALSLALCVVLALTLLPVRASAAGVSPAVSNNKHAQQYVSDQRWAETVKSYLYANPSGGLTRVEYIGGKVVIEDYNSQFQIQSSRTIPMELPIWGGFYAGETCNFVIFGQKNPEHSEETEVIRVVKYDKSWNRLGACSISGSNTGAPFWSGSLRCAEYGGYLYIHTCHMMFSEHQANMLLNIRESDMEWVSGEIGLGSSSDDYSYVSHSFNQFVLVDAEGHVVTLNHGDGYPRGLALFRSCAKAGQDKLFQRMASAPWEPGYDRYGESLLALKFPGKVGDSNTGVALGGFAETSSGYIMAYNYTADYSNRYAPRHLYMTYVDKETFGTSYWELTTAQDGNISNPQLVSTGLDGGYILWQNNIFKKVYYARYEPTGGIGTTDDAVKVSDFGAALSDCQPIVWNGQVVWYVTDSTAPVFYVLDKNGITSYQATVGTDAPLQPQQPATPEPSAPTVDSWAKERVALAAETGLVPDGLGNDYRVNITRAQFAAVAVKLYEVMGEKKAPEVVKSPFSDTNDPAVLQAAELGFVSGIGEGKFGPDSLVTREQMAVMLASVYTKLGGKIPNVTVTAFADDKAISGWAKSAVDFLNGQKILSGKGDRKFVPSGEGGNAKIEEALLVSLKMFEVLK